MGTQALYRCQNGPPLTGFHYDSLDPACEPATSAPGRVNEGVLGYTRTAQATGFSELYRCWNPSNNDHLPTFSSSCEGAQGYHLEGSLGFVKPA